MTLQRVYRIKFSGVYPLHVQKAERKQRTKDGVDRVIRWLTGSARRNCSAGSTSATTW